MEYTGERFMPGVKDGQMVQEHLHRYYSVLPLCEGKKVLDIASGEGYGASLIAGCAEEVTGVDISNEAVKHANNTYFKENLRFLEGSVDSIPMQDQSVDVVISFETIEHVDEQMQTAFLKEVKRVLKTGGLFVVSTPNKYVCRDVDKGKNPFHIKEFYVDEYYAFLKKYYPYVRFFYQNVQLVSVIGTAEGQDFAPIAPKKMETDKAHYVIAVCSDEEKGDNIASALLPGSAEIYDKINELLDWGNGLDQIILEKNDRIEELAAWGNRLDGENKQLAEEKNTAWHQEEQARGRLEEARQEIDSLKEKGDAAQGKLEKSLQQIKQLQDEYASFQEESQKAYEALREEKRQCDERVLALSNVNSSLKATVSFLESELHKIRGNRYYRFLVRIYKLLKRVKNRKAALPEPAVLTQSEPEEKGRPLVSIIIPVYNNAAYLRQCFDSALNQTYENIEVVAVDDCSPDPEVARILAEYEKNPKFHCYKNDFNSGISQTQNNCIIKAEGEWIAMLDCDDWLEPFAIEHLMEKILSTPGAKYGYTDRYNYNNETGSAQVEDFSCRPTHDYLENLLLGMYTCHLKIIHKDVFRRIGLHDPETDGVQDYDICLKAAFYMGDSIFAYLHEPVYYHRIHPTQETTRNNEKLLETTELLRQQSRMRMAIRRGEFSKLVSIVILSFEKKEHTVRCIQEIERTVKIPHEIILFDNGSSKETVTYLKEQLKACPNLVMKFSPENLRVGGGRREALKYVKGEYLVCLDNDIVVYDDWLVELLVRMEFHSRAAAVCGKLFFPDSTVQFNGGKYLVEEPFIQFSLIGQSLPKEDLRTCTYEKSDWVPGGATLFRTEVYRRFTGLNAYPNAFEDNDASFQIEKMGYTCLNSPASLMLHNHIMMLPEGEKNKEKRYLKQRYDSDLFVKSALVFYRRNGLIVKDDFIFRLMGLSGVSDEEVVKVFQERVKEVE